MELAADASRDIDRLARAALDHPPAWFVGLLGTRDVLAALVGLKTSRRVREEAQRRGGETVAFFPIAARTADELVLGEDDRHLDFRLSVLRQAVATGNGCELVLTATVRCHNLVGHAYLLAISPFHRLIVRSNLARAEAFI